MTASAPGDQTPIATSLGLPGDAGQTAIVERIAAMRLACSAETLDQVRRVLGLDADASGLACADELRRRLPADWHHPAVLAMLVVEVKDRTRQARVEMMRQDAIRATRGGSAG